MKRFITVFLVLTFLSSGICLAADLNAGSSAIPVSLDTIQQVWAEHSPDYSKLESDLNIAKKTFNDFTNAMDKADETNNNAALNSLLNSRDQAKLAYDVAAAQHNQKIQNAVLSAKMAFLTCWQDQLNWEATGVNLAQKQAQLSKNSDGLRRGYLSQKTYDDLKDTVDELQNTLAVLRTKQQIDETALKAKLGLRPDAALSFTYPELNETIFEALISKIDPVTDFASLQKNSVSLKVLQITYDGLSRYTRSYANGAQVEGAELNLKTAQDNLQAGFTTQYQNLINQYHDLKNDYRKMALLKDKLDKLQKQYDMGYATSFALTNLIQEYSSVKASLKIKESTLYGTYLTYLNMVAGN